MTDYNYRHRKYYTNGLPYLHEQSLYSSYQAAENFVILLKYFLKRITYYEAEDVSIILSCTSVVFLNTWDSIQSFYPMTSVKLFGEMGCCEWYDFLIPNDLISMGHGIITRTHTSCEFAVPNSASIGAQ